MKPRCLVTVLTVEEIVFVDQLDEEMRDFGWSMSGSRDPTQDSTTADII